LPRVKGRSDAILALRVIGGDPNERPLPEVHASMKLLAAAALALMLAAPAGRAWAQEAARGGGSGATLLPPRVAASYAYEFPDGGTPVAALLVLWRGQPQWYQGRGEVGSAGTSREFSMLPPAAGAPRLLEHEGDWNGIKLSFRFDPATDTALVAGQAVALGGGNVVLVDRIDGVGGAPVVVGTASVDPAVFAVLADPRRRGRAARDALLEALGREPRLSEFLR
jgi:hypothetical protein